MTTHSTASLGVFQKFGQEFKILADCLLFWTVLKTAIYMSGIPAIRWKFTKGKSFLCCLLAELIYLAELWFISKTLATIPRTGQTHKYTNAQMKKCTNTQIHKYTMTTVIYIETSCQHSHNCGQSQLRCAAFFFCFLLIARKVGQNLNNRNQEI